MKTGPVFRYVTPMLAAAGLVFAVFYTTVLANPPAPPEQQLGLPPSSPFPDAISGLGLVEANTRNITIGTSLSGVVSEVLVTEGVEVAAGAPLFRLDDRAAKAELQIRDSEVTTAIAQLDEAQAALADQDDQLKRLQSMQAGVSVAVDRVQRVKFARQAAAARVSVAKANIIAAQARLDSAKVNLDKLTVTAPVTGRILKVGIRVGEYADANNHNLIVMGNDKPLFVRVTIDENDLWRFKPDTSAVGYLRGNRDINFQLKFVRVDPYVMPKTALTGGTSERVDTRVLEAIYSITDTDKSVFIGQQVDVFIAAAPTVK